MKKFKIISATCAALLSVLLMLSGCAKNNTSSGDNATSGNTDTTLSSSTGDMFTERDFETGYDESTATKITISDKNSNVQITEAGTYILSGSTSDGTITVDVADTDKVQIVLNGVSVTSKTSAALYVKSADKVFVTMAEGTKNTLSNGGTFTAIDDNNIDGAIFSKSDITFNGEGTLNIASPAAHGIVGKDDVKITSGTYVINSASHGIDANDSIRIANATLNITAGKDGFHSENNDDNEKGYIYIKSGTIDINSDDDAIHAITYLTIDGGTFNITAAEGLEATVIKINDGTISINASDDGINAAKKSTVATPLVEINGGKITIVMGQGDTDGIDSNGDIIINGGTLDITANSPFDYDGTGTLVGGTVIVNGTEVTTLQNQMMGGGGMGGGMPEGMRGETGEKMPNNAIGSATPDTNNSENGEMPQKDGQRPTKPGFDAQNGNSGENTDSNRPQKPSGSFPGKGANTEKANTTQGSTEAINNIA